MLAELKQVVGLGHHGLGSPEDARATEEDEPRNVAEVEGEVRERDDGEDAVKIPRRERPAERAGQP